MNTEIFDILDDMGAETEDVIDRLMGDEEMYYYYIKQFPDNENIVNLKEAVEANDYQRAEREVHTLKGVALNLGFLPLLDATMDMLMEIRDGNPEVAMTLYPEVEEVFQEWADVIRENCKDDE